MIADIGRLFLDIGFILVLFMVVIYYVLNAEGMFRILSCFLLFGIFNKLIFYPLLNLPEAKYIWYIVWSVANLSIMIVLLKILQKYPNLQKITIPVSIMLVLLIFIEMFRHLERHFFETNLFKSLYSFGTPTLNWLIIAYLFAPIALLLVKSIRSRMSAKH